MEETCNDCGYGISNCQCPETLEWIQSRIGNPYSDDELERLRRLPDTVFEKSTGRFLANISALQKRVGELEAKLGYPHEEIADMKSRIAELEGVIGNLTRMVDTPEFKQTLAAIQGDNDWVTFSVFNPLGDETKCEVGDWLETLIESLPEARTALAGKGGEDESTRG